MPSIVAVTERPWASAPPNDAMAMPKPAARAMYFLTVKSLSGAAAAWANADGTYSSIEPSTIPANAVNFLTSDIGFPPVARNSPSEPDAILAGAGPVVNLETMRHHRRPHP